MKDTPDEIYAKQFAIFMAKPIKERFLLNLQLTELVRETTQRRIKRQHPEFNDDEVKIEMIKQFYSNDFSADEMEAIIRRYYDVKQQN